MAINREQTSSDFVLIWPYEIQCHIFSFLSTEELVECLNVCLQWQRQLLQCTSLWHDLQLTNIRPDCFQMLHHNTAHVKALFINDDGTDLKAAFQMLMSCDFENLKSLIQIIILFLI
ncbi:hypothetical protein BDB00DRAFT_250465 [Zychaea mexicana]|uniref:uncharacterized protein n=1 Tax=Zychaea mexicana TaxID=64656 RepID=UPI0022FF12FD|nr:uncharacterized protein BDB00DRAFT_250465 [Zychaea mexicana]KAI9471368.1 hypothetical protein BDB00DRAFT_250465 [Zychaea mexicana]